MGRNKIVCYNLDVGDFTIMGCIIFVNIITFIRLIGTFSLPFIFNKLNAYELIIYVSIILLTDLFDGLFARKFNASTLFGALFDALADKLFGVALLSVLALRYPIMVLPIFTETAITLINTLGGTKGSRIESSKQGKFKMFVSSFCIVLGFITIYAPDLTAVFTSKNNLIMVELLSKFINNSDAIMNSLSCIMTGCGIMVAFDYQSRNKSDIQKAIDNGLDSKVMKLKKGKDLVYALFNHEYYISTLNEPVLKRLGEKNERKIKRK